MRTSRVTAVALLSWLLAVSAIAAQDAVDWPGTLLRWNSDVAPSGGPPGLDEPLASDRPDFTEASCTVGRGLTQLEMGYTFFHDRGPRSEHAAHSFPELLCRVGTMAEWLELRVGWNFSSGFETFDALTRSTSGSDDLYLGVKLGLTPQQGVCPEMALVPQTSVPLGSQQSAHEVLPGLNWLYGWDITDCISTAGSTQANLAVDEETADKYLEFIQSWTIGYSICERMGAYTEWFAMMPAGARSAPTEHYLDAGLTFQVSNDLQFDVRMGKGISSAAVDFFAGAGLVIRL